MCKHCILFCHVSFCDTHFFLLLKKKTFVRSLDNRNLLLLFQVKLQFNLATAVLSRAFCEGGNFVEGTLDVWVALHTECYMSLSSPKTGMRRCGQTSWSCKWFRRQCCSLSQLCSKLPERSSSTSPTQTLNLWKLCTRWCRRGMWVVFSFLANLPSLAIGKWEAKNTG